MPVRLSAKRLSALYAAINDPVFELRLRHAEQELVSRKTLDRELFELKQIIVDGIWRALDVDSAPPND